MKSPETEPSYDAETWETLQRTKNEAAAVNKGRAMGVPEEELARFMQEAVDRWEASQQYDLVYRFRKNMPFGTEEEIEAAGEQAEKFFLANKATQEKAKGQQIETEEELTVTISPDATFADLFDAIDTTEAASIEEDDAGLNFEVDIQRNFGAEILDEIMELRHSPAAANTKVLDFFKARGISKGDISESLPIKFKREQKKK